MKNLTDLVEKTGQAHLVEIATILQKMKALHEELDAAVRDYSAIVLEKSRSGIRPEPLKPTKYVEDKPHPTPLVIWLREYNSTCPLNKIVSRYDQDGLVVVDFKPFSSLCNMHVPRDVPIASEEHTLDLNGPEACQKWLDSFASPPY